MRVETTDRLIVALDVPDAESARHLVKALGDAVSFYKVGLQLELAPRGEGLAFASDLVQTGKSVFLDAKLFDIPETVQRAAENASRMGVRFLTVHAQGKTVGAAVRGRGTCALQILAVTVLTSMDASDVNELGAADIAVADLVLARARKAREDGADGIVASGHEVARLRKALGASCRIVVPGIRRPQDATNDQKRIAAPAEVARAGADHLVVGRPITHAPDPRRAALEFLEEIAGETASA